MSCCIEVMTKHLPDATKAMPPGLDEASEVGGRMTIGSTSRFDK